MSDEASFGAGNASGILENIDVNDERQVDTWAKKLNATAQQIRDAVKEVGAKPADVEAHLKGTRSTTNAEQTKAA